MIKIGLLGDCHYTQVALSHILKTLYQDQLQGDVHITPLHELDANAWRKAAHLDCLIVFGELHLSFGDSLDNLLKAFCHHPKRIIVLTEKQLTPLITHFLSPYCRRFYFISLGQTLAGIQQGLHAALFSRARPRMKTVNISSRLTVREYQVLKAVFSGVPVADLCAKFMVSEKTLSSHKMRALEKLQCTKRNISHHAMLTAALQFN